MRVTDPVEQDRIIQEVLACRVQDLTKPSPPVLALHFPNEDSVIQLVSYDSGWFGVSLDITQEDRSRWATPADILRAREYVEAAHLCTPNTRFAYAKAHIKRVSDAY